MLADFEMLKLCDVISGPVSSNYAKTAARESLLTRQYLTQFGMCSYDAQLTAASNEHFPSTRNFEQSRHVEGMFADCKPMES